MHVKKAKIKIELNCARAQQLTISNLGALFNLKIILRSPGNNAFALNNALACTTCKIPALIATYAFLKPLKFPELSALYILIGKN
jgi:hypothetical protein